jgi:2',3'-cyclic-nucleotide 2'-phosphodiesterase/3'-nucleotidase
MLSSILLVYGLILPCTSNNLAKSDNIDSLKPRMVAEGDVNLTILHINDLHGWLNPHDGYGGVATYMGYFQEEGFDPTVENSSFLLVSGGDQQTGPATATLSKGEAVIDVMNEMNFTAAAIGNHEFDYDIEWLYKRKNMSNFPILSANIYDKGTSDLANFTIPYVIQNHSGVNVGLVGLTTTSTPTTSHPKYTSTCDFIDYEAALRDYVPVMKAEGADIIIALTHVPPGGLISLAEDVADLNISVFLGGHAGGDEVTTVGNSLVAAAKHYAKGYARINLTYNKLSQEVISIEGRHKNNIEGEVTPVSSIQAIVDYWDDRINASEVLTQTSEDIDDFYPGIGIGELVTDGFIFNTNYSFGITNRGGGFRDYFRSGPITTADVVSVIPFENNLMEFNLTGEELIHFIEDTFGSLVFSGVRFKYTTEPFEIKEINITVNGTFIELINDSTYTGVITDYSWYVNYRDQFPNAFDTGIHYRDSVINYFKTLDDLSDYIDDDRMLHIEEWPPTVQPTTEESTTTLDTTTTTVSSTTTSKFDTTKSSSGFNRINTALVLFFGILMIRGRKKRM